MKKIIGLLMAGLAVAMLVTGCGNSQPTETTKSNVEEIRIETIVVEEIKVEEIKTENLLTERSYLDGEYEAEASYNGRVNTWENSTTYWD